MKLSSTVASNWPILSVLLVSAFIHVFRLDSLITVGGDMGYDLIKIKGILDGDLTLLGSPIGRFKDTVLYLGPLYYYLQAPFLVLFKFDPVGLMIPIIIGRLTTTFFVYLIAKKLFNWQTAIIAAVISSVSPYFVEKLGPPSQPYVVPAVVALVTFLVISKKTLLTFALLGFASGLMIHFHYLGFSVFLALILFAFYGFKNHRLQRLTTLFLGFFLSVSPVVLFELRNNFFLSKQIIVQFTSGVVSAQSSLLSDRIISAVNFPTRDVTGFRLPFVASSILLTISIVIALKKSEGSKVPIFFLISIVVINLLAVSAYSQQVQPHYLASLYVPLFIFAGATIYSLARFAKILPIILAVTIFLALVIGNDLNRTSGYTMPEDLTLRQIRQIARIIAQDAQGEFNITSTLDGDSRALPYRYLVDVYGKKPLDVQTYDRGDSLYIITRDPARSVRVSSLFEIASYQPSFVENTWNINGDIKLIKLSKQKPQELKSPKFITLVNPVRPRQLWNEQSIKVIEEQQKLITDRGLKSTWLISYENLFDKEVVDLFKKQDHEIGAFLEVSEKWATDSRVVYKIDEGDYYRPDKVFLSGYSPFDRGKLIKSYFKKFKEVFGYTPKSVGAWYIDANSQTLLAELGVISALTVSDQFDTDAASVWGKYWSMPFYPSKFNALEPARSQSEKLSIVNLQWAQRDLVAGYGKQVKDSRQSFQANDYINNGYDTNYFTALFENYLRNAQNNDFMQITIGLEVGQEAQRFAAEFARQLDIVSEKQKSGEVEVVTMEQFADWYQLKYPGISPSHLLADGDNFWYMSPKFRTAVFKDTNYKIEDLRYYESSIFEDFYTKDKEPYLKRNVPAMVDFVARGSQIDLKARDKLELSENFDRLTLKLDNRLVQINTKGVTQDGHFIATRQVKDFKKGHKKRVFLVKTKEVIADVLNIFKYSKIGGQNILGISLDGSTIIGFRDFVPGVYKYDFQIAARFLSPASIVEKWQP